MICNDDSVYRYYTKHFTCTFLLTGSHFTKGNKIIFFYRKFPHLMVFQGADKSELCFKARRKYTGQDSVFHFLYK